MRISIRSPLSLDELRQVFERLLRDLDRLGIERVGLLEMEFSLLVRHRYVHLVHDDGRPLNDLDLTVTT